MAIQQVTTLNFQILSKTNRSLTRTMKYFFIMLHVIFSLDFGFMKFKSPSINLLRKIITFTQSTIFTVTLGSTFFDPSFKNVYTYSSFFLDTLVNYVIILVLIVVKYTFHDYQIDLNSFDTEIGIDSSTCRVEYKIITGFFSLIFYRIFTFSLYYVLELDYSKFPIYSQVVYYIGLVGLDTILVVYTYVFYAAHLRLKNFTNFVESDKDIITCHYLYKNLADIVEKIKGTFDVVLLLSLLANTTDVTMQFYIPFANHSIKKSTNLHVVVAYVILMEQMLVLFAPAITAGLLAGQVDKLKLVLYNKLVTRDEPTFTKDVKRFVAYIEGRPLQFLVWRVVPLDWRLPVLVVDIAVTYLIVMIQFTHRN